MTRWPTKNFRPDPTEYDHVKVATEEAGWNMNVLLQAFLRAVRRDPQEMFKLLDADLKAIAAETLPRGRPKRSAD